MERRGERWGWTGGWLGGFLWVPILSIVWLFQGEKVFGWMGVGLFGLACAAIAGLAPWRYPRVRYWKLLLPLFLLIVAAFLLALLRYDISGRDLWSMPYLWTGLLPIFTTVFILGGRRWDG